MPRDSCGHVAFPKLRGLRVETLPADRATDERILIRLTDREQRDIFLRFCRDIVDSTILARTEEQAVELFSRSDLAVAPASSRWARDSRLNDQEQKGLIGELVVLQRHIRPALGAMDAA